MRQDGRVFPEELDGDYPLLTSSRRICFKISYYAYTRPTSRASGSRSTPKPSIEAGARDTARLLGIHPNTVCRHLKKSPAQVNPFLVDQLEARHLCSLEVEVRYATEWDEFWSFVGSKARQRWIWYLIERHSGLVLAWHKGRRQDQ